MPENTSNDRKAQIFLEFRNRIFSGHYWPRQKLVEASLAEEMNVSRTVIREILKDLSSLDLVLIEPNKGARVAEFSRSRLLEFVQVEAFLEGSAARMAATRFGRKELHDLESILHKTEETKDLKEWSDYNRLFHKTIIKGCGNNKLIHLIGKNITFLRFWFIQLSTAEELVNRNKDHRSVYRAISHKKADETRILMEKHVTDSLETLMKRIKFPGFITGS